MVSGHREIQLRINISPKHNDLSKKDCIVEVISEYGLTAKFCIVINLTDNLKILLSNQFIQLAAFLNAEIEFDTYLNIVDEIIISDDD